VNSVHDTPGSGRPRFAATIFVRNLHPSRRVLVPLGDGLARVLAPAVTSAFPARVLAHPTVRTLLARQFITRIDLASWDPEERQRRALRADMQAAIARLEQAEVDKLRQGVAIKPRRAPTGRPRHRWTPERIAQLKALREAKATPDEIAREMNMARESVWAVAYQLGLSRKAPRAGAPGAALRASCDPEDTRRSPLADAA
jgi:hypothetical protein